ncbi:hypothetical protein PVAP13_3NG179890 [Panicum virgatum]|uniref:Uncharacterized protein n=1 Tax=Panicum virgatum TaxID=38727 RepID=A0A8T0U2T9_PANVG|nr:hypothetical protein PVAP13_3NG179890 [Panicum virgatum]
MIGRAAAMSPSPFLTAIRLLTPNTAKEGPPYTGTPHPKSRQWNPARRQSDTTNAFATALYGRRRSTPSSTAKDRTYSAVTAALASRTSSTVSPSELASRTSTVVCTGMGTHALP